MTSNNLQNHLKKPVSLGLSFDVHIVGVPC